MGFLSSESADPAVCGSVGPVICRDSAKSLSTWTWSVGVSRLGVTAVRSYDFPDTLFALAHFLKNYIANFTYTATFFTSVGS